MNLKEMAAMSAVKLVKDGQIVGLGTGSTAYFAIKELERRIREEALDVTGIPTSKATEKIARKAGIPLTTLQEHDEIDIDIDGADQVDSRLNLVKGGGGAHFREKLVASNSRRVVIIVDESKITSKLSYPVPVEVLPFSFVPVKKKLEALGSVPKLRMAGKTPFITDNLNYVIDCDFGVMEEPGKLEAKINSITGVIENGIFTGLTSEVHVGTKKGVKINYLPY